MKYFIKIIKYIGIIVAICIVGFVVWALWFTINFQGDTYKDAEPYVIIVDNNVRKITLTTQNVIDIFYEFQSTYTEYQLISINDKEEKYHYFMANKNYQFDPELIFFYFKDIDKTVSCIVEISTRNNVLIKLYAVNEGVIFRKWKRINNYKEISREENRKIKKKFETEILNQLDLKWRHKRFGD
ncbi:MAG: hypothetical protein LBI45_02340 [Bacteroidales bacterium]|jgi:hypothetical protein|nr:hypothetical protein [Bacteroidales bacterium]